MKCKRCGADDALDSCWYCMGALCEPCWDAVGHCGHPEAAEANVLSAQASPEEGRAILLTALLQAGHSPADLRERVVFAGNRERELN